MKLCSYPKYKSGGMQWLGDVPDHWVLGRVKNGFDLQLGKMLQPKQEDPSEIEVSYLRAYNVGWERVHMDDIATMWANPKEVSRFAVVPGDLLVCEGGEAGRAAIMPDFAGPMIIQNALHRVRGKVGIPEKFLLYLLQVATTGGWLEVLCNKATIVHFTGDKLANLAIAYPPRAEADQIVDFLDQKTAKIDALIAEQYSLIERLKERQTSMISQAVTRGMDPNMPMKESGVDWLGDIPNHWELKRLKGLFRQTKRQNQIGKPVLSVYRDYGVIFKDTRNDNNNKTPEDLSLYQLVEKNDLVINKMKAWQGSLGISDHVGITSPDYVVFSPIHHEYPGFIHLLLRSERVVSLYRRISNGIRPDQWRLEPDQFLNLYVPLPPLQEQEDICSKVEGLIQGYNSLAEEAQRAIELLTEHRSALVTAVVTGKVDVRSLVKESS